MARWELAELLLELSRELLHGVLEVWTGGARTLLYLRRGVIVFAEEGVVGDTLGRLLLTERVLTSERYADVLRKMSEAPRGGAPLRFGDAALALGYLTPDQLQTALARQVQQRVVRCLVCDDVEWEFHEGPDEDDDVGRFPVPLEPTLFEAACQLDVARRDAILAPERLRYAGLRYETNVYVERFRLGGATARWLERLDGTRTIDDVSAGASDDALALLALLVAIEAVVLLDHLLPPPSVRAAPEQASLSPARPGLVPPPPPRPPDVAPPPSPSTARAAPAPASAPVLPRAPVPVPARPTPASAPVDLGDPRSRAPARAVPGVAPAAAPPSPAGTRRPSSPPALRSESIGSARGETAGPGAHGALRQPAQPPSSESGDRLRAERAFHAGRVELRAGRAAAAIGNLRVARALCPGAVEYALHLAWAELQLAPDDEARTRWAKELRRRALDALRQDRRMAFAHYAMGQLAVRDGDDELASRAFRLAVTFDPTDLDAHRHLRVTSRRVPPRRT